MQIYIFYSPWSTWAITDIFRMFFFRSIRERISSMVKFTFKCNIQFYDSLKHLQRLVEKWTNVVYWKKYHDLRRFVVLDNFSVKEGTTVLSIEAVAMGKQWVFNCFLAVVARYSSVYSLLYTARHTILCNPLPLPSLAHKLQTLRTNSHGVWRKWRVLRTGKKFDTRKKCWTKRYLGWEGIHPSKSVE